MDTKTIVGALTLLISIPSYWIYIRSIYRGATVPHMYSWLIWSLLALVGFIGQVSAQAGPGSWNTGVTALACFVIFVIAIKKGEHKLHLIDKILLMVAVVAMVLQQVIDNHTLATLLATLSALVGFVLTIKKTYLRPKQEKSTTFFLNGSRSLISLFALSSVNFLTAFYPICMTLANFAVLGVSVIRRRTQ